MILLIPLAILGLGLGLSEAQISRFERLAALDIASKLDGTAKKVTVQAEFGGIISAAAGDLSIGTIQAQNFQALGLPLLTEPWRTKRGRIRNLILDLRYFTLAGLEVEGLHAEIPECRYDLGLALRKGQVRLSKSGIGTGWVMLRAENLAKFIMKKFHEIKRCTVELTGGRVIVRGYGEFVIAKTDFFVNARLASSDGNQVILEDAKINLSSGTNTPEAKQVLLDILNPVVDLRKDLGLRDAVHVKSIEANEGLLTASGITKIPEAEQL